MVDGHVDKVNLIVCLLGDTSPVSTHTDATKGRPVGAHSLEAVGGHNRVCSSRRLKAIKAGMIAVLDFHRSCSRTELEHTDTVRR